MAYPGAYGGGYNGGGGYPGGYPGAGQQQQQQQQGGYGGGYGGGAYQQQQQQAPPPQQQYGYTNNYPPPQQSHRHGYPGQSYGGPPQSYPSQPYPPHPTYSHPASGGGGYGGSPAPHRTGPPPPSNTPQQFGHGAPAGYTFQYSNCTGKRKALLIGINYFGQSAALAGCINDTRNLSAFLMERYNYRREDMIILTDDQQDPRLQPTKANMLRAMQWLVQGAQPNDSLFLHYSGHGGQTADLDGDEDDGYDEVIYPVDYKMAGHITDDQLHHIVVSPLVAGVRLTAIFDSCHSGSVLDIPYIYSTKGILKEPNLVAEAGQGLLKAISAYASGDRGGVASAIMGFAKSAYKGEAGYKKTVETKTSPADVIMWSGSKDDQTSADATIASQATGAMSYAFITALRQNPKQSYVELLNSIRDILQAKYSQKPQLSCSHPLDTNLLFVM
ncbi:caspase domain-containing protein [Xylaria sp. CBS 124048]|nr:caspase domain-containing protein [Xylaria sp. CBS 124048]